MRKIIPLSTLLTSSLFIPLVQSQTVFNDDINKIDVYGRAEGQIIHSNPNTYGRFRGRLGFNMQRELSAIENSRVVAKFEWQSRSEINDNVLRENEDLKPRYVYVGIQNDTYGTAVFGRTLNPLKQIFRMTDVYRNYTPSTFYGFGIRNIDTSFIYDRQDSTLQYNSKFGIHEFQTAYVFGDENNQLFKNGMMASYRSTFTINGLKITPALGLSQFNRSKINTTTNNRRNNLIVGGLQTSYQDFTVALTSQYIKIDLDNGTTEKYFGMDSLVSYQWDEFKILGGYSFLDLKGSPIKEQIDWRVEAQWLVANNTTFSVTYDKELAKNNVNTNNASWIMGLRYNF